MSAPDVSPATLVHLAKYDTPTICNVIELFDVIPRNAGYMNGSIKACFPEMPPMVGFALTSTFRSLHSPPKGDVYGSLTAQVEAFEQLPGPAVVVFQDLDEPVIAATFGEVMCSTYKGFGAKGIITSGAGRDLDQVRAIGFPAFTAGTICSHAYCHILQVGIPVTVGGLWVETGALLHGDCNGVTTIPVEIASEVPDACAELARRSRSCWTTSAVPGPPPPACPTHAKASVAMMADLSRRLRGKRSSFLTDVVPRSPRSSASRELLSRCRLAGRNEPHSARRVAAAEPAVERNRIGINSSTRLVDKYSGSPCRLVVGQTSSKSLRVSIVTHVRETQDGYFVPIRELAGGRPAAPVRPATPALTFIPAMLRNQRTTRDVAMPRAVAAERAPPLRAGGADVGSRTVSPREAVSPGGWR